MFQRLIQVAKLFAISPEEGAETIIYLATSDEVAKESGKYFYKCRAVNPTKEAQDDVGGAAALGGECAVGGRGGWGLGTGDSMRHRLLIGLRSILIGWVTLYLMVFLVERPLLKWVGPVIGAQWIATVELGLDCAVLAATGWVVGRLARPSSMLGVLTFAATLTVWDISFLVAINVPWLLRLAAHTLGGDSNYFGRWSRLRRVKYYCSGAWWPADC